MKTRSILYILSLGISFAIDPLLFRYNTIYNLKTNTRFIIKGIAYQPKKGAPVGSLDPLADKVGCLRDVEIFKDLGINAIRVYEVDVTKNHDSCMKALSEAGIYVLIDLSTPEISVPRNNPYFDTYLLDHFKLKVDAFSIYDNILGFVAGNNVTVDINTVTASAFVKASIRGIKNYLKYKNINIPVGYSGLNNYDISSSSQRYFSCGSDPLETADFYGFIMRDDNVNSSKYRVNYNIYSYCPSFASEYGIENESGIDDINHVYNLKSSILSGGFLFEYSDNGNGYGIVDVNYGNSSINKLPLYASFKSLLSQVYISDDNVYPRPLSYYTYVRCEYPNPKWPIGSNIAPPPNSEFCNCIAKTFSCKLPPTFNQTDPNQFKILDKKISDLCTNLNCSEILSDAKSNFFGKLSGCTVDQKASYVLSLNFSKDNNADQQCTIVELNQTLVVNSSALNISSCDRIAGANVNVNSILEVDQDYISSYDPNNSNISSSRSINNGSYKHVLNTAEL
ncbi:1,3-beta-glucanosyltransferase GAS2 [Smittium culicis]|uniref:1,3-beta-glucanosyltransferase n=1 Tax=Smittium culicis TaxID=133412 RepID=A0A1R1Y6N8_9FUNG|nr:1,3-beta-glucanosyltransferase GAS2 [Smittium culicis]